MILNDIKTKAQQEKGFTIVELLIVVVVIAILAAITIVSYNGITNRANSSAAQSTAAALQKKIELFAADGPTGQYPKVTSDLTGAAASTTYAVPAAGSLKFTAQPGTAPDAATGKNTVQYQPCGTGGTVASAMTAVNGAKIVWWDFTKSTGQATTISVGDVSGTCATTNA